MENEKLRLFLLSKGLTRAEVVIVDYACKGYSTKETATALFVSEGTVKFHLTRIYKKFAVPSRAKLIMQCLPYLYYEKAKDKCEAKCETTLLPGKENQLASS